MKGWKKYSMHMNTKKRAAVSTFISEKKDNFKSKAETETNKFLYNGKGVNSSRGYINHIYEPNKWGTYIYIKTIY